MGAKGSIQIGKEDVFIHRQHDFYVEIMMESTKNLLEIISEISNVTVEIIIQK